MDFSNLTNEQKSALLEALLDDDIELAKGLMTQPAQPVEPPAEDELGRLSAEYKTLSKSPTRNAKRLAELEPQLEALWAKVGKERNYYGSTGRQSIDGQLSEMRYGPDEVTE